MNKENVKFIRCSGCQKPTATKSHDTNGKLITKVLCWECISKDVQERNISQGKDFDVNRDRIVDLTIAIGNRDISTPKRGKPLSRRSGEEAKKFRKSILSKLDDEFEFLLLKELYINKRIADGETTIRLLTKTEHYKMAQGFLQNLKRLGILEKVDGKKSVYRKIKK